MEQTCAVPYISSSNVISPGMCSRTVALASASDVIQGKVDVVDIVFMLWLVRRGRATRVRFVRGLLSSGTVMDLYIIISCRKSSFAADMMSRSRVHTSSFWSL